MPRERNAQHDPILARFARRNRAGTDVPLVDVLEALRRHGPLADPLARLGLGRADLDGKIRRRLTH